MEVSGDGKVAFLAGSSMGASNIKMPTLYSCHFDKMFKVIDRMILDDVDMIFPVVLKRMPGHSYLAMGGSRHIILVQYIGDKFIKLKRIDNVHTDFVGDMVFNRNVLYSKGVKEPMVKVIRFDPPILFLPATAAPPL